jgi:hypothetical protein
MLLGEVRETRIWALVAAVELYKIESAEFYAVQSVKPHAVLSVEPYPRQLRPCKGCGMGNAVENGNLPGIWSYDLQSPPPGLSLLHSDV